MKHLLIATCAALASIAALAQADCNQTSVGFIPIMDMGTATFNGWEGGLYPNGSNVIPASHADAGLSLANNVEPLDANGDPDPVNGKIVWLSIGMSNTAQESNAFINLVQGTPGINPRLVLVNGGVGGKTAEDISTPSNPEYSIYWNAVATRLANAGVTAQQVQAIWFKEGNRGVVPEQQYYDSLIVQCKRIMNELNARFPNARLCYVAGRAYGGYATGNTNPEPYAYWTGWAMKHLIEAQINGDPQLYYAEPGANSPWMMWGLYLWADGLVPRSDGLFWECDDFQANDGLHPSDQGEAKVASLLLDFFSSDPTTCPWFMAACETTIPEEYNRIVQLFPNPSSGSFQVVPPSATEPAEITVMDPLGQVVVHGSYTGRQMQELDLRGYARGMYLVKVVQDAEMSFSRLVLEN